MTTSVIVQCDENSHKESRVSVSRRSHGNNPTDQRIAILTPGEKVTTYCYSGSDIVIHEEICP